MIRPLREQPRLRVAIPGPGSGSHPDLDWFRIGGEQPLELDPALAFDQAGKTQKLPLRMPERAGAPLFAATLLDAFVAVAPSLRSYLLTGQGELVVDSVDDSPNVWRRAEEDWRQLAELDEPPAAHPHEAILLGGQRLGYWHWWIDILPRVWLLETFGALYNTVAPLVIPPPQLAYQRESLELLGLMPRLEPVAPGLTRFGSVAFTRGLTGGGSRFPAAALAEYAAWLRERLGLGDPVAGGFGRRIFVSRRSAASRRVINEAEIEPVLAAHGFSVVDPAEMSIADQVAVFGEAEAVVGPHGAGLTNLLFSGPRTVVVEIFAASAEQEISNYRVLASHLRFPYCRLLAEAVPGESRRGTHYDDMRVDPQQLERALALVL